MDSLDKYLLAQDNVEFNWSTKNCGHFAAAWVEQCEGYNPLAGVTFPSTPESIAKVIENYGSIVAMVDVLLSRPHFSPAFAVRGDLVLSSSVYPGGCGGMLGICNGSTVIFLREGSGIITLRMRVATHAWRIKQ